jgi:copper chaperone NosL
MDRRRFLAAGFALTPLAAALSACGKDERWPEGMQAIMWDRDTCMVCNMVISDRRFAGEIRGGAKNIVFKFDDPGCVALWLNNKKADYPWMSEPGTRLWIADVGSHGNEVRWLDGFKAHYVARTSPMGHNFGAVVHPEPGSVDFSTMCGHVVSKFATRN